MYIKSFDNFFVGGKSFMDAVSFMLYAHGGVGLAGSHSYFTH